MNVFPSLVVVQLRSETKKKQQEDSKNRVKEIEIGTIVNCTLKDTEAKL